MTVHSPNRTESEPADSDRDNKPTMHSDDDRRPEQTRSESSRPGPAQTMGGVSHTNPTTGEPFGQSQVFTRGRTIVADGGEADAAEQAEEDEDDEDVPRVKDVDHTPREGAPDASAVYERGGEGELDEDQADTEEPADEANEADDVPEAAEE